MQSLFGLGSRLRVAVGNGIVSMGRAVAGVNAAEGQGIDVDDVKEPMDVFLTRQRGEEKEREVKEPPRLPVAAAVPEIVRPGVLARLGKARRAAVSGARAAGRSLFEAAGALAQLGREYFAEPPRGAAGVASDMFELEQLINTHKHQMRDIPREPLIRLIDRIANSGFRAAMKLTYLYRGIDNKISKITRHIPFSPAGVEIMKAILLMTEDDEGRYETHIIVSGSGSFKAQSYIERVLSARVTFVETPVKKLLNKSAGLFPYINTSEYNLERWQIMSDRGPMDEKQEKQFEKDLDELNKEHCLIFAMKQLNVSPEIIHHIQQRIREGFYLKTSEIGELADEFGLHIEIHKYDNKLEKISRTGDYGPKNGIHIPLAIYEDHIFVYEWTPYSRRYAKKLELMEKIAKAQGWDDKQRMKYRRGLSGFACRKRKRDGHMHDETCLPTYRTEVPTINSLELVHTLSLKGKFVTSTVFSRLENGVKQKRIEGLRSNLDYIEREQKEYKFEDKAEKRPAREIIFIADQEATVKGGKHELLYCGFKELGKEEVRILERDDATRRPVYDQFISQIQVVLEERNKEYQYEMLDRGEKPVKSKKYVSGKIYFHNLKYDYFLMADKMKVKKMLNKNGQYYQLQMTTPGGYTLVFVDSWKLISEPLSGFGKMFGLPAHMRKQEAIAYEWYEYLRKGERCTMDEYRKSLLKRTDRMKFTSNVLNNQDEFKYDPTTKTFDPWRYYKYYLKYDVLVLEAGLQCFADKISELNEKLSQKMPGKTEQISMWDFLTISSISHYFMQVYGVYDGVCMMKGSLREYVAGSVYGGRTHVNDRYKKKLLRTRMNALDGVSLYPSAIVRMCREIGLPCGKAKKMTDFTLGEDGLVSGDYDHYVVTVKITGVGKYQRMPMLAVREESGIMRYSNDVPEGNIVVDKITLEDWVRFHKITYEIVEGVYWDEGYNKNMGAVIAEMFQMRLDAKKAKNNAMSSVLKLLMNASYGKTITKLMTEEYQMVATDKWNPLYELDEDGKPKKHPVEKNGKTVMKRDDPIEWVKIPEEGFNSFLYNNYNRILECSEIVEGEMWLFRLTKLDRSYNFSHVGGLILSYSKRIMNEIFDLCNDEGYPISYTDTDSIHMIDADVEPLGEKYETRYRKKLLGERLEQFHCDYTVKDSDGNEVNCTRVWADCEIDVDKKMYASYVVGERSDGKGLAGCYHLRMKGVSEPGLRQVIAEKFNGDAIKMYKYICKFPLEIDSVVRGEKVKFDFLDHKRVVTRDSFIRSVGGDGRTKGDKLAMNWGAGVDELNDDEIRALWDLGEEWEVGERLKAEEMAEWAALDEGGDGWMEGDVGVRPEDVD